MCNLNFCRNTYKANVLLLLLSNLLTCNIALILLRNKALGIWNMLMQKSRFTKMHHYFRFLYKLGHIIIVFVLAEG